MTMLARPARAFGLLPPEPAHALTLWALRQGLGGRRTRRDDPILKTQALGQTFANPIGLAAGFDKNAEAVIPVLRLGFGFTEAGSVTPKPQPGNPKPRVFRWRGERAVINRLGFNNAGLTAFAERLRALPPPGWRPGPVGANIGRNKETADGIADYKTGIRALAPLADYLVINVSSPNTPGLRGLQDPEALRALLEAALAARGPEGPPILIKIAPDLSNDAIAELTELTCAVAVDGARVAGLIVSNTTVARPEAMPAALRDEPGGLSGPPLFERATQALRVAARAAAGRLTLVGTGGVASGADAYAKIRAGASLVQLYTALIYAGPGLIDEIKRDLARLLRRDGFASVSQAVGVDL